MSTLVSMVYQRTGLSGRVLAACGIVIVSLTLLFAPAARADRPSSEGQLLLWLWGFKMAQEQERQRIDINTATAEALRAVPGMERRQVPRIIAERPYATLQDLARADLSPISIQRLARFLIVDRDSPSAPPDAAVASSSR